MPRIRRVQSQREQDKLVDEFITRGYTIKEQGQFTAKVKEKDWGEVIVHVFVFFGALLVGAMIFSAANLAPGGIWLFALASNVIYGGYCRYTANTVIIKVDPEQSGEF